MCFRYIWIPFNSNQCATWSLVIEIIPLRHHYTAPKIAIQARIVFIVAFVYFRTVTDFYLWNWIIHFINQNIIYIFRAFNSLTFNRDRNICLFWFVPCSVAPFVRFFRYLCVCVCFCAYMDIFCVFFFIHIQYCCSILLLAMRFGSFSVVTLQTIVCWTSF